MVSPPGQKSRLEVCHYSRAMIFGFRKRVTIPSWRTKHLPLRKKKKFLPGQGLHVFTSQCLSLWCLAFALTLFEASNGRTSPGNQLCFQGLSTLLLTRVAVHIQTHTNIHTQFPAFSHSFFCFSLTLPGVAVIELWQTSRVRPAPLYLGDWVNDLSITQPLLYSPSTDRVTHTAHLLRPVSPLLLFVATSYPPCIKMQTCMNYTFILCFLNSFWFSSSHKLH